MAIFLDACAGKTTPKTPIWLMRQAGRYQPWYQAIRAKTSFIDLCHNPQLSAEVTLRAQEELGVDAAIIFADILLLLEPLGVGFHFGQDSSKAKPGEESGPKIASPIRTSSQIDAIPMDGIESNVKGALAYVGETMRLTKKECKVPVLGFSGAPFTLACYMTEGGGSKEYPHTKALMYRDEGAFNALLEKLSWAVIAYLEMQIDAGADGVQLFDSWVGVLSAYDYERYVARHNARIFAALRKKVGPNYPLIHFATGNPALYPLMAQTEASVISVDHRAHLGDVWPKLGARALQGNLDSGLLLGDRKTMLTRAKMILDEVKTLQSTDRIQNTGFIFNLGHGILPQTQVADVQALVEFVHGYGA